MKKYLNPFKNNLYNLFTSLSPKIESPSIARMADRPKNKDCNNRKYASLKKPKASIRSLSNRLHRRSTENTLKFRNCLRSTRRIMNRTSNPRPSWVLPLVSPVKKSSNDFFMRKNLKSITNRNRKDKTLGLNQVRQRLMALQSDRLPPRPRKEKCGADGRDRKRRSKSRRRSSQKRLKTEKKEEKMSFKEKYKTIAVLGKGSNSNVYLSRCRKTKKEFAVKLVKKSEMQNQNKLKNLKVRL